MTDQLNLSHIPTPYSVHPEPAGHGSVMVSKGQWDDDFISTLFLHEVVVSDLRHSANSEFSVNPSTDWSVSSLALFLPDEVVVDRSERDGRHSIYLLLRGEGLLALLSKRRTHCQVTAYSTTPQRCHEFVNSIKDLLHYEVPTEETLSMRMWNSDDPELRNIPRRPWSSVSQNYPQDSTRKQLARLMELKRTDNRGGKIILWHGEPGTGKTNAIMALATEWDWAQLEVISDPEMMLENQKYMNAILRTEPYEGRSRLLIFEDCDNMVAFAGRGGRSNAMSRLLNLSDGLLGIGQDLLMLFTTNEPPENLDPAFTRPGRCLSHIKFNRFETEEVRAHYPSVTPPRPMTLAELWSETHPQVHVFDDDAPSGVGQYL